MRRVLAILSVLSALFCSTSALADKRDLTIVPKVVAGSVPIAGEYWALIIGIDKYKEAPQLETAVKDAKGVRDVLASRYGFRSDKIIELLNEKATRTNIESALLRLGRESKLEDSVFIYYAGHGKYDDDRNLGWWVPVEGDPQEPATFISNASIRDYVGNMRARHVYLVADSCFSGTLLAKSRAMLPVPDDKFYARLYSKQSRWALTSGGTEPVEDQGRKGHSIFAYYFIQALRNNEEPYLIPQEIALQVAPLVARNSSQVPRSDSMQGANDDGGQFVFRLVAGAVGKQPPAASAGSSGSAELEAERLRLQADREAFEREKREVDEREKLEAERKQLDEERRHLAEQQLAEAERKKIEEARVRPYSQDGGRKDTDADLVAQYRVGAERGDAQAQANLGTMYTQGRGVAKDDVEAVRWYTKAAEAGNATGQAGLGFMYLNGKGVARDDVQAMRWSAKAAEAGDATAQSNLGFMYEKGRGVAQDFQQAVRWHTKAAEAGNEASRARLKAPDFAALSKPAMIEEARVRPYEAPSQMGREVTGKDGAPMVLVPAGEFFYGFSNQRTLLSAFYMDKYELTTSLYAKFLQETGRETPDKWSEANLVSEGDRPVVGVTWQDADAYCRWAGKRLPTEQEWEKAARGTDGRIYPWGNAGPSPNQANYDQSFCGIFCNVYAEKLKPVDSYETGKSPNGIYNMVGNALEWTSSDYDSSNKVARGGSWNSKVGSLRSMDRFKVLPLQRVFFMSTGFRCTQDAR